MSRVLRSQPLRDSFRREELPAGCLHGSCGMAPASICRARERAEHAFGFHEHRCRRRSSREVGLQDGLFRATCTWVSFVSKLIGEWLISTDIRSGLRFCAPLTLVLRRVGGVQLLSLPRSALAFPMLYSRRTHSLLLRLVTR